eukprot:6376-Lingulodinium_polyedra.AAC.1
MSCSSEDYHRYCGTMVSRFAYFARVRDEEGEELAGTKGIGKLLELAGTALDRELHRQGLSLIHISEPTRR